MLVAHNSKCFDAELWLFSVYVFCYVAPTSQKHTKKLTVYFNCPLVLMRDGLLCNPVFILA